MASPGGLHALGSQISVFPMGLRGCYSIQSHPNLNAFWKKWICNIQLKFFNCCMHVREGGKNEKDFLFFFLYQKFLHRCGASLSEMLCCKSGPEQSVKFHRGLGLIPSPQPFLLDTLMSTFVKPVSEVPNNPHVSYPKLGRTAWTQGLTPQDCSPVGVPYKGSEFFNSFARV